jgi:hypothetical protein
MSDSTDKRPVSIRTGVFTPREFAAMHPQEREQAERILTGTVQRLGVAWFEDPEHREDTRENFRNFFGYPR